ADQDDDILGRMMESNRAWADKINQENPGFFDRLAKQQTPRVLWIGCSDSRVPGNESIGVLPGEVFFHRNIANQLQMVDFNGLSVLQYAVEWLRVRHIVVAATMVAAASRRRSSRTSWGCSTTGCSAWAS
ncbi:MAG TPA: carbonic anhydrase, partial [Reyranella sp.]